MSADLAQLSAKVDVLTSKVIDLLDSLRAAEKPMTRVAFAKRVGLSRWTIKARIDAGKIITRGGKIPPSELKKFGLTL